MLEILTYRKYVPVSVLRPPSLTVARYKSFQHGFFECVSGLEAIFGGPMPQRERGPPFFCYCFFR